MTSESVDYQDTEVPLVDAYCHECDTQINATELQESNKHVNDDKVFCTDHLHQLLEIPI